MGERIMITLPKDDLRISVESQFKRMVEFGYVKADKVLTNIVALADKDTLEARISLSFELTRDDLYSSEKITEKLSAVLKSSIVESVCHKRQVEDLIEEIESLKKKTEDLTHTVAELSPYKNLYEKQYEMRHGKPR
jgi:hypothetical protein